MPLNRATGLKGGRINSVSQQTAGFDCSFMLKILGKLKAEHHQSRDRHGVSSRQHWLRVELLDQPLPPSGILREIVPFKPHHNFVRQIAEVAGWRFFMALESKQAAKIFKVVRR